MADNEATPPSREQEHESDLMGSAKILAEAAQSGFGKEGKPMDKAKVAGAAEDILEAAKSYGKLDESSGVGQYVDKAEGYLHSYHSSSDSSSAPAPAKPAHKEEEEEEETEKSDSGGGASDVINMAKKGLGGFFS